MTNEELKKKIVDILEETEYEWTEEKNGLPTPLLRKGYVIKILWTKSIKL